MAIVTIIAAGRLVLARDLATSLYRQVSPLLTLAETRRLVEELIDVHADAVPTLRSRWHQAVVATS